MLTGRSGEVGPGMPHACSLQQWEGHMLQWPQPQEAQILWLKVTLCPPALLSASHPQVGGENGTGKAWLQSIALRARGA